MRKCSKVIIVMIFVLAGAGCRRLDPVLPGASAAITVTPTTNPSSVVGLITTPATPAPASETPMGKITTPAVPAPATETPTPDAGDDTENYRAEFEGTSVIFTIYHPKEAEQASGRHEDLSLFINRNGHRFELPASGNGVPLGYLVNDPLSVGNPPQFYNLDEDAEAEIVLELLENGTDCCAHTIIGDYAPAPEADPDYYYVFTWNTWGPSRTFPRFLDLDEDGTMELISQDEEFSSYFGPFTESEAAPIQVWRYNPEGLQDVTRDFPESIRQDAANWWSSYTNELSDWFGRPAALSATVADQCMLEDALGEGEIDWNQAEEIFAGSTQGATISWQDYLMQLSSALEADGYTCQRISSTLPVPAASPLPTRLPLVPIRFDTVSFAYDPSLVSEITSESLLANPNIPEPFTLPDYLKITMDGDIFCNNLASIYIIPVNEYIQINPGVEQTLSELRNLLDLKPTGLHPGQKIPRLPDVTAAQVMQASISYFDFQNGSGVRSLLLYTNGWIWADVCLFQYTFQGLTHDGRYFISATIPIFIPVLDEKNVKGKYFFNDLDYYIQYIEALVSAQPAESFSPDLSILDDMMRSLLVE
jgi:hypothetical protein